MVTSELIEHISKRQLLSSRDIVDKVSEITGVKQENSYVYKKFTYPLLKKRYLHRVRKNLYHVSMIRKDYYIGFHAALEFYGVAYSYRNRVLIGVTPGDRFDVFSYQNTTYAPFLTKDIRTGVSVQTHLGSDVYVCSKERLFIECIRYPDRVGGWEEALKSLQGLGGIDFDVLLDLLFLQDNQSLLRRVGLVLELLRETSLFYEHLDDNLLERIKNRVMGDPRYLEKSESGELDSKWLLYVSPRFRQHLRGI